MLWNSIYWVLVASAVIATSAAERSRHKRSLSFLKSLFWDGIGQSQEECTHTRQKPLKQYEIFILPNEEQFYLETAPKISRSKNYNEENFFMQSIRQFHANDRPQETFVPFRGGIMSLEYKDLTTEKTVIQSTSERPYHVNKLTLDSKSTLTLIPKNSVTIEKNVYKNHQIAMMPTVTGFISPLITMPRKYSYEQIRGKGVQTFFLDKNADVQVTESANRLSRPPFVEDRIRDVILSVPSFPQQGHQSTFDRREEEVILKTNVEEQMKDAEIMYTGRPIVVSDDTTRNINASVFTEDNEINKTLERGDIR